MLKDTELDELARAVAPLDDEDAGRLEVFLAIDGVLNTHSAWRKGFNGHRDCDPDAMANLNALCARTRC